MPSEPFPQAWGPPPQSVASSSLSNASSRATRLQESHESVQQIAQESETAGGGELDDLTAALARLDSVRGSAQADIDSLQSEMAAMTLLRDAMLGGSSAPSLEEVAQAMSRHVEREQLAHDLHDQLGQDLRDAPLPMLLVPSGDAPRSHTTSSAEGQQPHAENGDVSVSRSHGTSEADAPKDRCKICSFPMPCVKHNPEEWLEAQRQRCKPDKNVVQALEGKGEADGKSSGSSAPSTVPKEGPAAQQVLGVGSDKDEELDISECQLKGLRVETIEAIRQAISSHSSLNKFTASGNRDLSAATLSSMLMVEELDISDCELKGDQVESIEAMSQTISSLSPPKKFNVSSNRDLGAAGVSSLLKQLSPTVEDQGEIDECGLDPEQIQLVMSQVECTRAKAVAALKANPDDIVEAIMQLTS